MFGSPNSSFIKKKKYGRYNLSKTYMILQDKRKEEKKKLIFFLLTLTNKRVKERICFAPVASSEASDWRTLNLEIID